MDELTEEVPYYDIIILDEIEGILNQLHSPTMNGQAEQIYKYLGLSICLAAGMFDYCLFNLS